jgi:hypothetical protein
MTISKILVTNNTDGNHSPDTWAMAAAEMLANTMNLTGQNAIDGQRLVIKFADVLIKHFDQIQKLETKKLENDAKHLLTNFDDELEIDLRKIVQELQKVAKGTVWEAHYQSPSVQVAAIDELRRLFYTSMHVDRLAFATKNPDNLHAATYMKVS